MELFTQPATAGVLRSYAQPLWDTVLIGSAAAQTATIPIFATGIGGAKTQFDTNIQQNGQLSAPDAYSVTGVMIEVMPRAPLIGAQAVTDLSDMQRLVRDTNFVWYEGSSYREVINGPVGLFPCGIGVFGCISTNITATIQMIANNGGPDLANRFNFGQYGVNLRANESFRGELRFVAGGLALSNSLSVRIYLAGVWAKSIG